MGTGAEVALPKILLGGGLGALGGALSQDPSELTSFINQTGGTGSGFRGRFTVDPGDLLARAMVRTSTFEDALRSQAAFPTDLGPAAMIQTPAFSFGGALPAPIGISVTDPGFLQRPGLLTGRVSDAGMGSGGGGGGGNGGNGGGGGGGADDSFPPFVKDPPGGGFNPFAKFMGGLANVPGGFGGAGLSTAMPTGGGELQQFLDAINMLQLGRGRPIVQGGLG